jgi:hypothetical protein
MAICMECEGIGAVVRRTCHHTGCCPCSAPEEACDFCDGQGRICPDCGEPIELDAADTERCADCQRALDAEEQESASISRAIDSGDAGAVAVALGLVPWVTQ